jgi:hypothetical protein
MTADYYAAHDEFTAVGEHGALFDALPSDVAGLCRVIQGLLIHDHSGLHLYGDPPASFHRASRETLPVSRRIIEIMTAQKAPLTEVRQPFERTVGTCRDFSLMLCAMLRQQGVAARVRCGFARYFDPPSYEDHWICKYWKADEQRWALADAQLDDAHKAHLSIHFDTTDVPSDQFIYSWRAWRRCQSNPADAARFGHGDDTGAWFVRVNLARDLLAVSKREISPWDTWCEDHSRDRDAARQCDRMAVLAEAATGLEPLEITAGRLQDFLSTPPWHCQS